GVGRAATYHGYWGRPQSSRGAPARLGGFEAQRTRSRTDGKRAAGCAASASRRLSRGRFSPAGSDVQPTSWTRCSRAQGFDARPWLLRELSTTALLVELAPELVTSTLVT